MENEIRRVEEFWEKRLAEIRAQFEWDEDGCDENDDPLAYHLLKAGAPAPFLIDVCGSFALYTALNYHSEDFYKRVPELLAAGSDPNEYGNEDGLSSVLHMAAYFFDAETVSALLDAGANPKALDKNGKTPLECALENKNNGAIRVLTQRHLEEFLSLSTATPLRSRL